MKDKKSILLLLVSFLLIVVSLALLWTWGYNYNNKKKDIESDVIIQEPSTTKTVDLSKNETDPSLYKESISSMKTLDSTMDKVNSLKFDIGDKIAEFNKLRDEIMALLNNPKNKETIAIAQQKILELQNKIELLSIQNAAIEKENKRLAEQLSLLAKNQNLGTNNLPNKTFNTTIKSNDINPSVNNVAVAELNFVGINDDGNKTIVSSEATVINKFTGSFIIKNNESVMNAGEIFVVIVKPDGKVLKTSSWDSGTFESKEGRKIFSCKVKYDCNKGESKKLLFSISSDQNISGDYNIFLYQNGNLVARTSKSIS